MPAYIVAYDFHKTSQDDNIIVNTLKSYGTYWCARDSVWIVSTDQSASELRDNLKTRLDAYDRLIVARLDGETASAGYAPNIGMWLKANL